MKTFIHFWSYLAYFFLEWQIFQSYKENQNIPVMLIFFRKFFRLRGNVEKYFRAGRATQTSELCYT